MIYLSPKLKGRGGLASISGVVTQRFVLKANLTSLMLDVRLETFTYSKRYSNDISYLCVHMKRKKG